MAPPTKSSIDYSKRQRDKQKSKFMSSDSPYTSQYTTDAIGGPGGNGNGKPDTTTTTKKSDTAKEKRWHIDYSYPEPTAELMRQIREEGLIVNPQDYRAPRYMQNEMDRAAKSITPGGHGQAAEDIEDEPESEEEAYTGGPGPEESHPDQIADRAARAKAQAEQDRLDQEEEDRLNAPYPRVFHGGKWWRIDPPYGEKIDKDQRSNEEIKALSWEDLKQQERDEAEQAKTTKERERLRLRAAAPKWGASEDKVVLDYALAHNLDIPDSVKAEIKAHWEGQSQNAAERDDIIAPSDRSIISSIRFYMKKYDREQKGKDERGTQVEKSDREKFFEEHGFYPDDEDDDEDDSGKGPPYISGDDDFITTNRGDRIDIRDVDPLQYLGWRLHKAREGGSIDTTDLFSADVASWPGIEDYTNDADFIRLQGLTGHDLEDALDKIRGDAVTDKANRAQVGVDSEYVQRVLPIFDNVDGPLSGEDLVRLEGIVKNSSDPALKQKAQEILNRSRSRREYRDSVRKRLQGIGMSDEEIAGYLQGLKRGDTTEGQAFEAQWVDLKSAWDTEQARKAEDAAVAGDYQTYNMEGFKEALLALGQGKLPNTLQVGDYTWADLPQHMKESLLEIYNHPDQKGARDERFYDTRLGPDTDKIKWGTAGDSGYSYPLSEEEKADLRSIYLNFGMDYTSQHTDDIGYQQWIDRRHAAINDISSLEDLQALNLTELKDPRNGGVFKGETTADGQWIFEHDDGKYYFRSPDSNRISWVEVEGGPAGDVFEETFGAALQGLTGQQLKEARRLWDQGTLQDRESTVRSFIESTAAKTDPTFNTAERVQSLTTQYGLTPEQAADLTAMIEGSTNKEDAITEWLRRENFVETDKYDEEGNWLGEVDQDLVDAEIARFNDLFAMEMKQLGFTDEEIEAARQEYGKPGLHTQPGRFNESLWDPRAISIAKADAQTSIERRNQVVKDLIEAKTGRDRYEDTVVATDDTWDEISYKLRTTNPDLTEEQLARAKEIWETATVETRQSELDKFIAEETRVVSPDEIVDPEDDTEAAWNSRKTELTEQYDLTPSQLAELDALKTEHGDENFEQVLSQWLVDNGFVADDDRSTTFDSEASVLTTRGWSSENIELARAKWLEGEEAYNSWYATRDFDTGNEKAGDDDSVGDKTHGLTNKDIEISIDLGIGTPEELAEIARKLAADELLTSEEVAMLHADARNKYLEYLYGSPQSGLIDNISEKLNSVIDEIGFNVADEKKSRTAIIDRRYEDARVRLGRQFGIDPGGPKTGRAMRAFEGLERQRLDELDDMDIELGRLEYEVEQNSLALLTDTMVKIGGLFEEERQFNETLAQTHEQFQETIRQFQDNMRIELAKLGLETQEIEAIVRKIDADIEDTQRRTSFDIASGWANISGEIGFEEGEIDAEFLGISLDDLDEDIMPMLQTDGPVGVAIGNAFEAMLGRRPTASEVLSIIQGQSVTVDSKPTLAAREAGALIAAQTMERQNKYAAIAAEHGIDAEKWQLAKEEAEKEWAIIAREITDLPEFQELNKNSFKRARVQYETGVVNILLDEVSGYTPETRQAAIDDIISDIASANFPGQEDLFRQALDMFDSLYGDAEREAAVSQGINLDKFYAATAQMDQIEMRFASVWNSVFSKAPQIPLNFNTAARPGDDATGRRKAQDTQKAFLGLVGIDTGQLYWPDVDDEDLGSWKPDMQGMEQTQWEDWDDITLEDKVDRILNQPDQQAVERFRRHIGQITKGINEPTGYHLTDVQLRDAVRAMIETTWIEGQWHWEDKLGKGMEIRATGVDPAWFYKSEDDGGMSDDDRNALLGLMDKTMAYGMQRAGGGQGGGVNWLAEGIRAGASMGAAWITRDKD